MEYKDQINMASDSTANQMIAKGFHDDDRFMDNVLDLIIDNVASSDLEETFGVHRDMAFKIKFKEVWGRNRKLARIALIHSELSEMVEGIRKDAQDDKLPHRKMEEVELADTLIRMEDYAGTYGLDLGGARDEKEAYNLNRPYKHGKKV